MDSGFDALLVDAEEVDTSPDVRAIEETILVGLFSPTLAPRILELTRPGDFYFSLHRDFAQVAYSLLQEGRFVDSITFRAHAESLEALDSDDDGESDKLLAFVAQVVNQANTAPPPAGKVEAYLDLFVGDARRRLAKATIDKAGAALDKNDLTPDQATAAALRAISDLDVGRRLTGSSRTEGEELEPFFAALEARQGPGNDFLGLNTGFTHLNRVINGFSAGLIVLAAAPSTGKTTLAKQIADNVVARHSDAACLFVSLEQSKEELRVKTLSRLSGVENRDLQRGRLDTTSPAWAKIVEAKDAFGTFAGRLQILEGDRETTVDRIRLAAIQLRQKTQASRLLIIVDYLQIIPTSDAYNDIRQKVNFITSELRRLGRDLDAPVVAISSVNRAAYNQIGNGLDAFKESGDIEFSADVALILKNDKEKTKGEANYLGATRNWSRVFLDVVKNRNGERARIEFDFYPEVSYFSEKSQINLPEG